MTADPRRHTQTKIFTTETQRPQRKKSPRRDTDLHRKDFSLNHENTKTRKEKRKDLTADGRRRTQTDRITWKLKKRVVGG